eukprot:CAMPEP_0177589326 /NCGR_PEP_ID=MMETSP0419_2-20121207/6740_1 /TAXON_ID=582737 /ORGANISM="Tetraselmis sp., Strain GSL018" /LENGTH=502 /DNA_ID=CAMNT_0019079665 /DNA_START=188 /DNA_END=1696 /DNA_ORIENTATION=+
MINTFLVSYPLVLFVILVPSSEPFSAFREDTSTGGLDLLQAFVYGGRDTTSDKFPYLASLRSPSDGSHICTGAIVAERVVLTAAHCLEPDLGGAETPLVDFGRTCTSCVDERGVRRVGVRSSIKHPNWRGSIRDGADLALLVLDESVEGPYLRVLPQEDPAESFSDLKAFKFAGYGLVRRGRLSDTLQEADLYYRSEGFCRQVYRALRYVLEPKDTICATGLGRAEVCRGDSGGPLILKGETPEQDLAVGVLSGGGTGCGEDIQLPALFTNLYLYQNDLRLYVPESGPAVPSVGPSEAPPRPPLPPPPPPPQASPSREEELFALVRLKLQNLRAASLRDWGTDGEFCGWTGVGCDADGHVQRLEIPGPGVALQGTLPRQWSALGRLEEINLRFNEVGGPLPPEWSTLRGMRKLVIPGNRLTGTLPREWSTMTNMETLFVPAPAASPSSSSLTRSSPYSLASSPRSRPNRALRWQVALPEPAHRDSAGGVDRMVAGHINIPPE